MTYRIAAALLLIIASSGCRMCSDCGDYTPCVADGPYAGTPGRAGSIYSGTVLADTAPQTPEPRTNREIAEEAAAQEATTPTPSIVQPPGVYVP